MLDSIWPKGNGADKPLPKPNVVAAKSGTPPQGLTPEAIRGILVNPIYAGLGPFPALADDAAWVRACAKVIEQEGAEQFLVNVLFVLRECFGQGAAEEAEPTYQGKTISEWITDLKHNSPAIHSKACDALGAIGKPAVPALAAALKEKGGFRAFAASILMNLGPDAEAAVSTLVATLTDQDAVVRLRAAQALVKITPNYDAAIPTLIESLKVKVEFARADAATILGDLGPEAKVAVPALREALQDRREQVRQAAAQALKKIEGE